MKGQDVPTFTREGPYKTYLRHRIERELQGSLVIKLDPSDIQGIPDMGILFGCRWGALEAKISRRANIQPNQEHWVTRLNDMSFAAFIYPEIEEEVLDGLYTALQLG